jgi:hypothetical protein
MLSAFLSLLFLQQRSCPDCLHQGVLPCNSHTEVTLAEEERTPENGLEFCSWFAACEDCRGTGFVDCQRCTDGERTAEIEKRAAEVAAWMRPNPLETALGRSVGRVQTKHHEIVVEVPVLPEGKKKVKAHALAHRLAGDLEHVATRIAAHYSMTAEDYRARMRMWIWDDLASHRLAMEKFLGTITEGDFKMLGRDPVFSVWDEPNLFDTVPGVRALFAHNTAHMLLSNAFEPTWVGDIGGGWFDAGLGHWYEYELFGRTLNYCLEESTLNENYENGQWRAAVRKRLEREKEPLIPALLAKRTGQMSAAEHALCWSFYDWILAAHPGKVRPILAGLKKKVPARQVFTEHLAKDVFALEPDWRAWVAATYPVKGDEPRTASPSGKRKK